jgi:carboxyl-terminal processing protease
MKRYVAPILLAILVGILLVQLPLAIAARASDYEFFDPVVIVKNLLTESFVEELSEERQLEMRDQMVSAMVSSLGDPYTQYVPYEQVPQFEKQLRGTYVGIGAEIDIVDDYLTIVTPMDDSPSLRAGVMAGDTVLDIEGESTYQMGAERAMELLTGQPGTQVTIRLRHKNGEEEQITIMRDHIVTRTIKGTHRVGEEWDYQLDPELGLGYIRIAQFNRNTAPDLRAAIEELMAAGLNGLVLDVRFNPGGELETAVEIADLFLAEGDVASVVTRDGVEETYSAVEAGTLPHFPLVVLINETSASASEILAGSLQDNGRAKVLGERSYGKGSVQEVRILPDKLGTLKLTTAHYYLPSGGNIQRQEDSIDWGVDPDDGFHVDMSIEQYQSMIEARRQFEIITNGTAGGAQDWADPHWIRETVRDVQLAAALDALRARVAGEDWPRVGDDSGAAPALTGELEDAIEVRNRLAEELARADARFLELRGLAVEAGREPLLPANANLAGGEITVVDEHGNIVGRFRITDGDLARALELAGVEPIEDSE